MDPDGLLLQATTPRWTLEQWDVLAALRWRVRNSVQPAIEVLRFLGVSVPPVQVERICDALGIQLHAHDQGDPDVIGSLKYAESGQPVITVRAADPYRRQRFTVAHELGHLLLHPHLTEAQRGRSIFDEPQANRPQEREANRFAADLLMPPPLVEREVAKGGRSVRSLADAFMVSEQAMDFQLRTLGLR